MVFLDALKDHLPWREGRLKLCEFNSSSSMLIVRPQEELSVLESSIGFFNLFLSEAADNGQWKRGEEKIELPLKLSD